MTNPRLHSLFNRWADGLQAAWGSTERRNYRKELLRILDTAQQQWALADYGAGYLYQSCVPLGLRGFRETEMRVTQMDIGSDLQGKSVLEIGCNTGFLSLQLSGNTRQYVAFDNNPFLVEIARLSQATLRRESVDFRVTSAEDFPTTERYDVVLSFANHSTWDGNMTLALGHYFAKLHHLTAAYGLLFFESHHPALENKAQVRATLAVLQSFFAIEHEQGLTRGSPWDRGRTFVKARRLETPHPL